MTSRISGGLYASLLALFTYATQFILLPSDVLVHAQQEAWLSILLSGFYALLMALLGVGFARQFSRKSLAGAARLSLGRWVGGALGLLQGGFWFSSFFLALRVAQDFVVILLLPGTPGWLAAASIATATLYATWAGLEPIARLGLVSHLTGTLFSPILPLLLLREMSYLQVRPFLYNGWLAILQGTSPTLYWFGEMILVLSLVPHLAEGVRPYRWTAIGVLSGTALLTLSTALITLVFGPNLPTRLMFPGYELLALISLTEAVERVQAVLVLVWLLAVITKLSLCLLVASQSAADGLTLRGHKGVATMMAVAGVAVAQIWPGVLQELEARKLPQFNLLLIGWEWLILGLSALVTWSLVGAKREGEHG